MVDKVWGLWYHSEYSPTELVGFFPTRKDAERAEFVYRTKNSVHDDNVEYMHIEEHSITSFDEWNVDHIPND